MKQENCCTPEGQIKRYKDCIGCDRKPKQEEAGKAFYESADKVIVVKRQETLEEAADKYGFRVPYDGSNDFYDKEVIKHFIAGAKWMQEQMYSEGDMKKAFNSSSLASMLDVYDSFEEFIKQFKKK